MSDEWLCYPCRMDEHYAFVSYDHGIRETLDQIAPPQLLRVRLTFKHPRPNGFPASEESPGLNTLKEELEDLAREHAAIYVGHFSVGGARQFHIYTGIHTKLGPRNCRHSANVTVTTLSSP